MSDAVSNAEIEDVLSSIRRLVSEGGRPHTAATETAPSPEKTGQEPVAPEGADRLVLTPALRVSEPVEDAEEVPAPEAKSPSVSSEIVSADSLEDEEPDSGLHEDEAEAPLMFAHSNYTSEDPEEDLSDADLEQAEAAYDEDEPGDEVYDTVADMSPEDIAEEGYPMPAPDSRILRWETVSNPTIEPYEPDEPGDSDYAGTNIQSLKWQGRDTESATSEIETPDTMAERIEAEAMAYATETVEETLAPELENVDLDDSVTLDEAMLREMVADIVRQELQGALGERITRNVRKLVRREIHRALAAQDLG
ncbi:hypothetical protein [Shimia sp. SDUM112013]|uniref:hypothetical protein n=1 Tax=Shimia sp. SDUM112013 TaxID=3136160 RepID=UPI0032ECC345